MLSLPAVVHAFVADVGLLSRLQGPHFDFKKVCLSFRPSHEVNWESKASLEWLLYISFSSDELLIPASVITTGTRTASAIQVKK